MSAPLVTIGLPVHNGEAFLEQALVALAAQTCRDVVILVSDNASTDATPNILARWAERDSRFLIHRQTENIGAAANFGYVLDQARTPYFMFAAYDDWWSPNYVDVLLDRLRAEPERAIAAPTIARARLDGTVEQTIPYRGPSGARLNRIIGGLRLSQSGWFCSLFRTEALRPAYHLSREFGHTWAIEHVALLPFLLADQVTGDERAVFYQRQTGNSEDRYKPKTPSDQWAFIKRFMEFCWRALGESPLSIAERAAVAPFLIGYTNRRAWKFRRLARSALWGAVGRQ